MQILLRIIVLVTVSLIGGLLYPVIVNIMILANVLPVDSVQESFGQEMTQKTVVVWMVSVLIGIGYIFLKSKLRFLFLASPLLMPSLFAMLYMLSQG